MTFPHRRRRVEGGLASSPRPQSGQGSGVVHKKRNRSSIRQYLKWRDRCGLNNRKCNFKPKALHSIQFSHIIMAQSRAPYMAAVSQNLSHCRRIYQQGVLNGEAPFIPD